MSSSKVIEGLYNEEFWKIFSSPLTEYVRSPIQSNFVGSKAPVISRSLRHAVVDLLDVILTNSNEHVENDTTIIGTEHRLFHSRRYKYRTSDEELSSSEETNGSYVELDISSLAPTVFYQLREEMNIPNLSFRQSFADHHLKDFTNPGKSGSLMFKTFDELFILKTLRKYEARLLMKILSGYHLKLTERTTLLNRYVGLYCIRFPSCMYSSEIYVVVMANAFTPSLQVHEVFDLKGSKVKRRLSGHLSADKLRQLKDVDFTDLYPHGIRIPSNVYHRLRSVIANDVKVLRKLHITDFSLILGVRHLDMTEDDLMQQRPSAGLGALYHMSYKFGLMHIQERQLSVVPSRSQTDPPGLSVSYLRPLQMIGEEVDRNLYFARDRVAHASLPIPGLINRSNQRVYLYLSIVDILQKYDTIKTVEQLMKKITDPSRCLQYSVIEPREYEQRIMKFLFETVFIDGGDDFCWPVSEPMTPVASTSSEPGGNAEVFAGSSSRDIVHVRL